MSDNKNTTDKVADSINQISNNDAAITTINDAVTRGPYWLRNTLYILSLIIGTALTALPIAQAFTTGDAATALNASYGIIMALSGLFGKLNITKPAS